MRWDRAQKCKILAEDCLNELVPNFFKSKWACVHNIASSMELYKGYVFLGGQKEVKEWLADEESSCHSAFNPGASKLVSLIGGLLMS